MNLLVSWVWHIAIKTFDELGQHANDPDKHSLALRDAIGIDELLCDQGVEAGGAFDRGIPPLETPVGAPSAELSPGQVALRAKANSVFSRHTLCSGRPQHVP